MASRLSVTEEPRAWAAIRCWGDFGVADVDTGADLRPRGRKARALLAYLAMHPDKPVSREKLTGLLWGERADEQARASLRQTLFELRGLANADPPLLRVEREAITLIGDAAHTDMQRWRGMIGEERYEALLADLPDRDDLLFANLDGIDSGFDEWLQIERTRQRDALTALVADASAAAVAAGCTRVARALHGRLVELHPEAATSAPQVSPVQPTAPPPPRRVGLPASAVAAALLIAGTAGAVWYKVDRPGPPVAAPSPSREVRDLYDSARGIVYQRKGQQFPAAEKLLRRALTLDPTYVPAIAYLAAVVEMGGRGPEAHDEAERLARRAVQLDPNNAKANGVLGMILQFRTPEARAVIKKAAALDGNDPEIQFWLSQVLGLEGDYAGRLQALRRAAAIDPLWHRASGSAALASWEMGYPEEAERHAAQLRAVAPGESLACDYALDWSKGSYAEVVRDTLAVREGLGDTQVADWKLGIALLVLGREQPARLLLRLPPPLWRIATGIGPGPGELEPLLIASDADGNADAFEDEGLQQMLRQGRTQEIVAAYDRQVGRFGRLAAGRADHDETINDGVAVALALRREGRDVEAGKLLAQAESAIRKSLAFGRVPNWFDAAAAKVWAAQGRKQDALTALRTAMNRGWHYAPMTPRPDMGKIPAFAGLRGDPEFESLRQRELNHYAKEQQELGPVPV